MNWNKYSMILTFGWQASRLAGWLSVCFSIFLIRFIVWIKNILIEYSIHRRMIIICIVVHDPLISIEYWMFFVLFGIVAGRRIDNLLGRTNLFINAHFIYCRFNIFRLKFEDYWPYNTEKIFSNYGTFTNDEQKSDQMHKISYGGGIL